MTPRPFTPKHFEPLWVRVERNRVKLAIFMLVFALVWALAALVLAAVLTVTVIVGLGVVAMRGGFMDAVMPMLEAVARNLGVAIGGVAGAGVLASIVFAVRQLSRPPLMKLLALGARRPDKGEYPVTKRALHDMSIAAGLPDKQPHLFVIESSSVNAFMLARGDERAYLVVTSGLAERFDIDEQRAVLANLMVRLRAGDIQWGTVVSALMTPIWLWRDAGMRAEDSELSGAFVDSYVAGDRATLPSYAGTAAAGAFVGAGALGLAGPLWIAYFAAVMASELVALGHRRSHLLAAESADAEGMFLLKDPTSMLRTLKRAIEADNRMSVAAPLYAHLFYIWAGDDLIDEDDPEWQRLRRLREVIGVFGLEDAGRGDDLVVEGLPPMAPVAVMDSGELPPPKEIRMGIPAWARMLPLATGLVVMVLAGGHLFQVANFGQPLGQLPSDSAEWAAYQRAFLRAENLFFVVALGSTLFSALVIARLWGGVLTVAAHGLFFGMFDILARSIPEAELGRSLAASLGVGLAALAVAGVGGVILGSLAWGGARE